MPVNSIHRNPATKNNSLVNTGYKKVILFMWQSLPESRANNREVFFIYKRPLLLGKRLYRTHHTMCLGIHRLNSWVVLVLVEL